MAVTTRPPQTPVTPRSIAERPRRWPKRFLVAVFLLALVAVSTGLIYVLNLEPLAPGSARFTATSDTMRVRSREVDAFGAAGIVNTIEGKPNGTFRYGVSFVNRGRVSIVVTSIGARGDDPNLTSRPVQLAVVPWGAKRTQWIPFAPFALSPGQEAAVRIEVQLGADVCRAKHAGTAGWWTEPVTFTVGGLTRHTTLESGEEIRVEGVGSC